MAGDINSLNLLVQKNLGPHYSLFIIFLAHYSLFIIKKGHYSLIIIPHPDPHLEGAMRKLTPFYINLTNGPMLKIG